MPRRADLPVLRRAPRRGLRRASGRARDPRVPFTGLDLIGIWRRALLPVPRWRSGGHALGRPRPNARSTRGPARQSEQRGRADHAPLRAAGPCVAAARPPRRRGRAREHRPGRRAHGRAARAPLWIGRRDARGVRDWHVGDRSRLITAADPNRPPREPNGPRDTHRMAPYGAPVRARLLLIVPAMLVLFMSPASADTR